MKNNDDRPNIYHLLIRYSDNYGPEEGTIKAHMNIIGKLGYVWLGKFGLPISEAKREAIRGQVAVGKKSYLLLLKSIKTSSELIIAELEDIRRTLPRKELNYVPEYYRKQTYRVGAYLKIKKLWTIDISILRSFRIASSALPALQSISEGMGSFFFLIANDEFSLVKARAKKLAF